MRISSKGQVTIPVAIRQRLGLLPNSEVEFDVDGEAVRIRAAKSTRARDLRHSIVDQLKGRATTSMTTDEILKLTRR